MLALNCINIMPPNDHYTHQNSCDNKAITILRAQLAYGATLCDVIIVTFRHAHVSFLVLLGGEDGEAGLVIDHGDLRPRLRQTCHLHSARTTRQRRQLIGRIDRRHSSKSVRGERNGLR